MKLDYQKLRELVRQSVEECGGGMVHPTAAPAPITIIPNKKPDHEGKMAKQQIFGVINDASQLEAMLLDDDELPSWVQSKIARASDYIAAVKKYLEYELARGPSAMMPPVALPPLHEQVESLSSDDWRILAELLEKAVGGAQGGGEKSAYSEALDFVQHVVKYLQESTLNEWGEASISHIHKFERETGKISSWVDSTLDEVANHFEGDPDYETKIPLMSDRWRAEVVNKIAKKVSEAMGFGLGYPKGSKGPSGPGGSPAWHRKEKEGAEVIPFPDQGDEQRKVAAEATAAQAKKKAEGAKTDVINVAKYMFQHKQLGPALAKIKGDSIEVPQFVAIMAKQLGVNTAEELAMVVKRAKPWFDKLGGGGDKDEPDKGKDSVLPDEKPGADS